MSAQSVTFDKALREASVPALARFDFAFDGSRTFRLVAPDRKSVQIINFQLGQRSLSGKFTVNLGVFLDADEPGTDPSKATESACPFERRSRLGLVRPVLFPRLAERPYLWLFFGAKDKWWTFSSELPLTLRQVAAATDSITSYGLPWLRSRLP